VTLVPNKARLKLSVPSFARYLYNKRKQMKKSVIKILFGILAIWSLSSTVAMAKESYTLKVVVDNLRNSKGVVQFALYNRYDTIPDEKYSKTYKMSVGKISNKKAVVVFKGLPKGKYAVNILHDENKNGKIDKGLMLPIEGIGFSNFKAINMMNKPSFKKASFMIRSNMQKTVKVIYL